MRIELINPSYFEGRTEFKVTNVKRKWDILIMVVEGEYSIFLKEKQKKLILKKGHIMLIPAGVEFEREALEAVADKAIAMEIGARGMRSVMESIMTELMFSVPSDETIEKVIITGDAVKNGSQPVIIRKACGTKSAS